MKLDDKRTLKLYRVRTECEVAGQHRTIEEDFSLTDVQAKELLPPYGNVIVQVTVPHKDSANVKLDRRKRSSRKAANGLGSRPAVD